jgi:hypothetical protein
MGKALAQITSRTGVTYVFDRDAVAAIYDSPLLEDNGRVGPLVPHVRGIAATLVPIGRDPQTFLASLEIADQFVGVDGLHGEMRIRASAVSLLLDKVAGVSDPRVKCVVFIGGDYTDFLQVAENLSAVRQKIDAARTKERLDA